MIFSGFSHSRENRYRHGKLQGAGEIHHQKGKGLRYIPCKEIRQRRTAQTIGYKLICQVRSLVFRRALQLLGLFNHFYDSVVSSGSCRLLHTDMALPFFYNRTGIGITSCCLPNRNGFSRHRSLVYHGFTGINLSIQGNHISRTNNNFRSYFHFMERKKYLFSLHDGPDFVHIQCHRSGKVIYRLLMRPFFQRLTNPEKEHDGRSCTVIAC